MKKVVLTGGAGSGKTTTINRFQQLGYLTVPETAIDVMDATPTLRSVDQFAFQQKVVDLQIEREAAIPADESQDIDSQYVFLDRSVIDSMAYCLLRDTPQPPGLDAACQATDYHAVFALETLNNFPDRPETGRTSTQAMSRQTYDLLFEAYSRYEYTVISIPDQPVEERIQLVLSHLGLKPPF